MKTLISRKVIMLCGGILAATLAAGCYGGDSGYSNNPYGYYGSPYSYNADSSGYSYPGNYSNSYNSGYQHGVRADENRDRYQARDKDRPVVVTRERREPTAVSHHSAVDHDKDSH
jgi:hypothetical protein